MEEFYRYALVMVAVPTFVCCIVALMNLNLKPKTYYKHGGHRWIEKR